MGSRIQLQQRNCSRFTRDFSRRSTDQTRKELPPEVAACASALKIYLSGVRITCVAVASTKPQFPRHRRCRLHRLESRARACRKNIPAARLTVIDDFRSGDFKNLRGYRGDFVAADLASLDWRAQFGDEKFDAIFHLASITDTTLHDQFPQVHDNVESFRRLLRFRAAEPDPGRLRLLRRDLRRGERSESWKRTTPRRPMFTPSRK